MKFQVTVYVDDENDNPPVFDHESYEGKIKENCISGTEVEMNYPIKATDADTDANAQVQFSLRGDGREMFRIDKNTGKVYFNSAFSPLDREERDSYQIRLIASDKGGLRSEVKLNIVILDENDNAPVFSEINILGDNGVQVLQYDVARSGISIIDENNQTNNKTPIVANKRKRGSIKSQAPLFSLPEHIPVGTSILRLVAKDKDAGENAAIKYEMTSETYIPGTVTMAGLVGVHVTQYFTVNPISGEVAIAKSLPAESEFRLNISASDKGGLSDNVTLKFYIKDNNDHAPVFDKSFYNFNIEEGAYKRTALGKIIATDADFGQNANVSYSIVGQSNDEVLPFAISEFAGVLSVNGKLDRETRDKYSFKVVARDNARGSSQLSSSVEVDVNVLDVNDNAPKFYGYDEILAVPPPEAQAIANHNFDVATLMPVYYATVAENSPVGTPITRVFANDSDFSGNGNGLLLFDIPQRRNKNLFAVDSKDGVITTAGKLDYEAQNTHNVTVVASDLGSPSLSSSALLVITVIDVPDDSSYAEVPVFAHR